MRERFAINPKPSPNGLDRIWQRSEVPASGKHLQISTERMGQRLVRQFEPLRPLTLDHQLLIQVWSDVIREVKMALPEVDVLSN